MEKESVIKMYSDGFIIRKHNCRIVCLKKNDGWEIHTQRYVNMRDKTFAPTLNIKRWILRSCVKYSEDSLLEIAHGISIFNNSTSYIIENLSNKPKGETIIVETTYTLNQ